jgi:hypothetical protein
MQAEPFAIQICRRFLQGETVAELQQNLGIPAERIEARIRAAVTYWLTRTGQHEKVITPAP